MDTTPWYYNFTIKMYHKKLLRNLGSDLCKKKIFFILVKKINYDNNIGIPNRKIIQ